MILSIDIGIKNLSLCMMNCTDKTNLSTYSVHLWDVYNTLEDDYHCISLQKSGKICDKKCSLKYTVDNNIFYTCKTHFPKEMLPIKKENNYKPKLIKNYLLQDLSKIILTKLYEIYNSNQNLFNQLTEIIIELQPTFNPSMKLISHIIYGKLIDLQMTNKLHNNCTIKFVRASQKLRAYTGPNIECKLKGKYAQRKFLSVCYTKWFLENKFSKEQKEKWLPLLESKATKADMSDTLLMAINGLFGIPKKQRINKNGSEIK
jgi:hypothetical protein